MTGLGPATAGVFLGIAGCLLVGTVFRWVQMRRSAPDEAQQALSTSRLHSVRTWWLLFLALVLLTWLGPVAVAAAFAVISMLVLHETLQLLRQAPHPRRHTVFASLLAIVLGVSGPAFTVLTSRLAASEDRPAESLGWFLLLILLTSILDMSQAWWGHLAGRRVFGERGLAPRLSPGKTWEGLLGGFLTTTAAAMLLGPWLTGYGHVEPLGGRLPAWTLIVGLGLALGLAGIAGDLSASWLKRRSGVKDSGTWLPGQGGFLDRFDSLSLTAPVFYLMTRLVFA